MDIIQVANRKSEKEFFELPWFIYANDPNWIPHLVQDEKKVFDPSKNKMFRHGTANRWILKSEEGKVVGRIAAFVNKKYSKSMKQPTGGIGFFECIDDQEAANHLFDTAKSWLEGQGMEAVDGPINFGEKNMFWGLLIENFTSPNSYGMNYHPPYYKRLFENYGFKVYYNQLVYKRDLLIPAQEIFVRKYKALMADPEFSVGDIRGKDLETVAEDFRTVYNNAWAGAHGFKEMSALQAKKVMQSLKPIIDKKIIVFAYHNQKPIAFYVNIPELNEIFKHVNGNLNLWGKLIFLYHKLKKTPTTMVGIVFGVDRDYHGKGVEGALIAWAGDNLVPNSNYTETILTWIGDFNPKMMHVAENLGAEVFRKLATYRYLFDREKPFERIPLNK
ncbi:hypothetical protein [Halocola ammonii]